jgi:hypothetical protein
MRSTAFASLVVLPALITAPMVQAQAPTDATSYQQALTGNVFGGGGATISGGGSDMLITQSSGGAGGGSVLAQVPRRAQGVNGTTGGLSVQYLDPERAPAGREAWLIGGGENAEVVYANPAGSRRR